MKASKVKMLNPSAVLSCSHHEFAVFFTGPICSGWITAHLSRSAIEALLDPASHIGFSARIALEQAEVARRFANEVDAHLK
jgi:hypothetical protein